MSTYVVGDLQGCANEFHRLLEQIEFSASRDRLWLAGDLVNRGPASLDCLRAVRDLGDAAVTVLGNHDLHLLAAAKGIRKVQPGDTFQDVLDCPARDDWLDWLRHRPLAHVETVAERRYLLVHAGLLPQWSVEDAIGYARELEAALRGTGWTAFLKEMYGNRPDRWDDRLSGSDRLRVIVNALTRLRFCNAEGVMDFDTKESAEHAPAGFMPWFDVPGRRWTAVTVITGHWSTLGLQMTSEHMSLDTGCVWGGALTAVRLEDRAVFSLPCEGYRRPGATA